jgi:hypothetical protein
VVIALLAVPVKLSDDSEELAEGQVRRKRQGGAIEGAKDVGEQAAGGQHRRRRLGAQIEVVGCLYNKQARSVRNIRTGRARLVRNIRRQEEQVG